MFYKVIHGYGQLSRTTLRPNKTMELDIYWKAATDACSFSEESFIKTPNEGNMLKKPLPICSIEQLFYCFLIIEQLFTVS